MKKLSLLILVALLATGVAMAGTLTYQGGADVLGAHNGYGRGCVMCHAPHSGSLGNGVGTSGDPQNGMYALWGQDLTPLYGQTFNFSGDGAAKYPVTLPSAATYTGTTQNSGTGLTSAHDANTAILFCLSCHDGVLTKVSMMQGQTVETLPIVGGTAPTLLAKAAPSGGTAYSNDHPVGGYAIVGCTTGGTVPSTGGYKAPNSTHNWDCTGGGSTPVSWTSSSAMNQFVTVNYKASFWNGSGGTLASFGGTGGIVTAVTCTTCHDQHSMTMYTNSNGSYSTMFFIKGQYTPSTNGNSVAQFCRNCHGGESNELNGLMNVPTT